MAHGAIVNVNGQNGGSVDACWTEDARRKKSHVRFTPCAHRKGAAGGSSATVDLDALARKNRADACSKKCLLFGAGICKHVVCALGKKGEHWLRHIRREETVVGARDQLQGSFPLPNIDQALKRTKELKDGGSLMNLVAAPIVPRLGGSISRKEANKNKRQRSAREQIQRQRTEQKKEVAKAATSEAMKQKRDKIPRLCSHCRSAGHRISWRGEWKCPELAKMTREQATEAVEARANEVRAVRADERMQGRNPC